MFDQILSALEVSNVAVSIIFFALAGYVVLAVVLLFISSCYNVKRKKYERLKNNQMTVYDNKISLLDSKSDSNTTSTSAILKKIELRNKYYAEKLQDSKQYDEIIDKYKRKADFFNQGIVIIVTVFVLISVLCMIVVAIESTDMGGHFSSIRVVENVCFEDIIIEGYYNIDYANVEQDTLVIFIKNNSTRVLESAKITESNTNTSEYVYQLEPGQEKILTIEVYPNADNEYNFEISDIEFKE